jgi:hypothetical protein
MIEKMIYVGNEHINVSYDFKAEAVYVVDKKIPRYKTFGGWDNLFELWQAFADSFSIQVTYDDACAFFQPDFKQTMI